MGKLIFFAVLTVLILLLFPQAALMFLFIGGVVLVGFLLGWCDANRPVPPQE